MRQTQKRQRAGCLDRVAFIAKNTANILQQNTEFLLPTLVLLGIGIAGLVGAL